MTQTQETLNRFFEEKEITETLFTISHNDKIHIIDTEMVIDLILNHATENEQSQILDILVKIDFQNGNVNHFLEHLATGYITANF